MVSGFTCATNGFAPSFPPLISASLRRHCNAHNIILAVLIAAILIYATTKPAAFHVQRSTHINAPAEDIFPRSTTSALNMVAL